MEERRLSMEYLEIGRRLIEEKPELEWLRESDVQIAFLASSAARKSRGRPRLGECERVPAKYRWAVPFDYSITIFEPNAQGMDDRQMEALVFHELLHIAEGGRGVRPHDREEFDAVIDGYGLDWYERGGGRAGRGRRRAREPTAGAGSDMTQGR